MLENLVKTARRRAQFGLAKINPIAATGRMLDRQKLNVASRDAKSAVNKTGQAFAYRELGPGYERGYDDRVKKRQKDELARTSKAMQQVSENNRKRLERLNNIQ